MSEFGETLEEMDLEAFMNARDWFETAITAAGGEITDAGIGMGRADLGVLIDGAQFSVHIIPRKKTAPSEPTPALNLAS